MRELIFVCVHVYIREKDVFSYNPAKMVPFMKRLGSAVLASKGKCVVLLLFLQKLRDMLSEPPTGVQFTCPVLCNLIVKN